jgi:hypothetical protein
MTAAVSLEESSSPQPARSNSLDDVDRSPDAAFYIQIGIDRQVCICGSH